jgi:hypothetical protein
LGQLQPLASLQFHSTAVIFIVSLNLSVHIALLLERVITEVHFAVQLFLLLTSLYALALGYKLIT